MFHSQYSTTSCILCYLKILIDSIVDIGGDEAVVGLDTDKIEGL
jgi:hypothetical protein